MSIEDLLNEASQGIPEGWRPTEGDQVVGLVKRITDGWSDQSESNYPIIVVHDEATDKDISVHAFHTVLMKEIIKQAPQIGERIAIRYDGETPLKSNKTRSVKLYTVVVEGRKADYGSYSPGTARHTPVEDVPPDEDTPY